MNNWWKLSYGRENMLEELHGMKRYVACAHVSKRLIFDFISSDINPSSLVNVFGFGDYYSFGIIHSVYHGNWYMEKCSTLGNQFRYTTDTIWDTFPWPQAPTQKQVEKVATAAMQLHHQRTKTLKEHNMTLRALYRLLEQPGKNPIKDLHAALDKAVMEAYGFDDQKDVLSQLLDLNLAVAANEEMDKPVQPPGWPQHINGKEKFITEDCVRFEG